MEQWTVRGRKGEEERDCHSYMYLHISNRLHFGMALAPGLVHLHQALDVGSNLTEIQVHVLQ